MLLPFCIFLLLFAYIRQIHRMQKLDLKTACLKFLQDSAQCHFHEQMQACMVLVQQITDIMCIFTLQCNSVHIGGSVIK